MRSSFSYACVIRSKYLYQSFDTFTPMLVHMARWQTFHSLSVIFQQRCATAQVTPSKNALLHVLNRVYTADEKCATVLVALDVSCTFGFWYCQPPGAVRHFSVQRCRSAGVRSRVSTFHSIHVAGWWSHQLARCRVPQIPWWHTTCHWTQHVRLHIRSSTSQSMHDSSSHLVPAEWFAAER